MITTELERFQRRWMIPALVVVFGAMLVDSLWIPDHGRDSAVARFVVTHVRLAGAGAVLYLMYPKRWVLAACVLVWVGFVVRDWP